MIITTLISFVGFLVWTILLAFTGGFYSPRTYPKGHVHEYDPTGEYTYKHQNPRFKND